MSQADIPSKTGLVIMAVNKRDSDKLLLNPGPDYLLREDDSMVVLGQIE